MVDCFWPFIAVVRHLAACKMNNSWWLRANPGWERRIGVDWRTVRRVLPLYAAKNGQEMAFFCRSVEIVVIRRFPTSRRSILAGNGGLLASNGSRTANRSGLAYCKAGSVVVGMGKQSKNGDFAAVDPNRHCSPFSDGTQKYLGWKLGAPSQ